MSRGKPDHWVIGMVFVYTVGLVSTGHAEIGRGIAESGRIGSIPGTAYGGITDPSMVQMRDGFRVIPSIAVMERYDSNVFFQAKVPGLDRSDYVTTMAPQIRGLYGGSAMTANATIGANAEYYAKNNNLNYIGVNAALSLDLSQTVDRLWKGMTFRVFDSYRYSPEAPSLLVGNQDSDAATPFTRGQQVARVRITSNAVSASGSAPISRMVSLTGGYSQGFIRFGTSEVQQNGPLLDYSFHTFNVGVLTELSPRDSITVSYLDSSYNYGEAAGSSFTTRGGTLAWMHMFSPSVTLNSVAGAQVRTGGIGTTSSSSSGSGSQIVPTGGLTLTWRDQTTSLSLLYWIGIVPSYQFEAQPLLTNTVSFTMVQKTPIPEVSGLLSINYGRGNEFGSTSNNSISFESYSATGGVVYEFTPKTFLNLSASYAKYDSQFGEQGFSFPRSVVSLSIVKAFY